VQRSVQVTYWDGKRIFRIMWSEHYERVLNSFLPALNEFRDG